jgi:protein-arginine kinase activator protein McsA
MRRRRRREGEKEEKEREKKEEKEKLVCKFCDTKLYSQYKELGYCAKCTKAQARPLIPFTR